MATEKRIVLRIDPELHRKFKAHCAKKGITMSRAIMLFVWKEVKK